jgi:hypothetical protein
MHQLFLISLLVFVINYHIIVLKFKRILCASQDLKNSEQTSQFDVFPTANDDLVDASFLQDCMVVEHMLANLILKIIALDRRRLCKKILPDDPVCFLLGSPMQMQEDNERWLLASRAFALAFARAAVLTCEGPCRNLEDITLTLNVAKHP